MNLADQQCEVCQKGAPKLSSEEIARYLESLDNWALIAEDGIDQICKVFEFENFVGALDFANKVGALAEQQNHHPAILVEWGKVTVRWWTHKIEGLHQSDMIMAAKTDLISR